MKHITEAQYARTIEEAKVIASKVKGCRQAERARCEYVINTLRTRSRDVKNAPKHHIVIFYTHTDNFGTRKWGDYYTNYTYRCIDEHTTYRETDKSIIIEYTSPFSKRVFKEVISKDKIIAWKW